MGETSRRQELDAAGRDASPVLQQREMRGDARLLSPSYSIRDPNHRMMLPHLVGVPTTVNQKALWDISRDLVQ